MLIEGWMVHTDACGYHHMSRSHTMERVAGGLVKMLTKSFGIRRPFLFLPAALCPTVDNDTVEGAPVFSTTRAPMHLSGTKTFKRGTGNLIPDVSNASYNATVFCAKAGLSRSLKHAHSHIEATATHSRKTVNKLAGIRRKEDPHN